VSGGVFGEEEEGERYEVGEEVHEDGYPVDPGEIAEILRHSFSIDRVSNEEER
jgi:hypothetical protein